MRKMIAAIALSLAALGLSSCGKSSERAAAPPTETGSVKVTPEDLHPCRVTGTQLTTEDCDAAQYWLDKSKPGTAAFNTPRWMLQGQTRMVTLAVGTKPPPPPAAGAAAGAKPAEDASTPDTQATPDAPAAGAPQDAREPPPPPPASVASPHDTVAGASDEEKDRIIDYQPFVGAQMAADLEGGGFEIKALSPRVQPVADNGVTTWSWQVTAKDFGKRTLIMKTAVVMMDSQGKANPLIPTSLPKPVSVWIGLPGILKFITDAPIWLKAIAGLLAAIGAALAAWRALKAAARGGAA